MKVRSAVVVDIEDPFAWRNLDGAPDLVRIQTGQHLDVVALSSLARHLAELDAEVEVVGPHAAVRDAVRRALASTQPAVGV